MKSRRILTIMTLTFAVLGTLLIISDLQDVKGLFVIGAGFMFLGLLTFIGLIISLVIGSSRESNK